MSNSLPQFEEFCQELTDIERNSVTQYLQHFCPPGEDKYYRNYFFRLYWLASRSNSKKIVELGCCPGGSTIALMWAVNRNNGQLWSCDISTTPEILPFSSELDLSRRARVNDTKAVDFGNNWTNGQLDMIYLDTGHAYQDTCEEVQAWLPHLKEGGLFVFHDTEIYKTDVLRALFDTVIKTSKLFEFHHLPDCHGHGILQWYSGAQTSTTHMRSIENNEVRSLTSLLLTAK